MRAILATAALLSSLAACAMPQGTAGPAPRYQALRAYISPPEHGGLGFYVNRPAYTALFEIVPGRGTSMLYPSPGYGRMDGFVFSGIHNLTFARRANHETYLPAFGRSAHGQPRFLFLIASERPLDLSQFGSFGLGMRSALGMHFASLNAYDVMEEIAYLTLPSMVEDGSWTTDLYVYWPNVLQPYDEWGRRYDDRVLVRCNGYSMYVPLEYLLTVRSYVCPDDRRTDTDEDGRVRDSTRVADEEITQPERRRPVPKATNLRERITQSSQLSDPSSRRAGDGGAVDRDRVRPTNPGRGETMRERARPQIERRGGEPRDDAGRRPEARREQPRNGPPPPAAEPARPRETPGAARPATPAAKPAAPPAAKPAPPSPSTGSKPTAPSRRPTVEKGKSGGSSGEKKPNGGSTGG